MNSCLYQVRVRHARTAPRTHAFSYRLFIFCLDLDEIDAVLAKLRLAGRERFTPYRFLDSDHLDCGRADIRANLEHYLQAKGIPGPYGRIRLVTQLRTFGHLFNPVSFYFVEDRQGHDLCALAEVGNTFAEMKLYLLEPATCRNGLYRDCQRKLFYISPFSELNTQLHFQLKSPAETLALAVNESREGQTFFTSSLCGRKRELNDTNLALATARFPFVTLGIVAGIHWQALRLWAKGLRVHRKRDDAHLQCDTAVHPASRHRFFTH